MIDTLFIHTPKTAGRSLLSLLRPRYTPEDVLYGDWPVITPKASPSYRLVAGHLYLRDISLFDFHGHYRITILRDPIDQAVSHYYHINERTVHGVVLSPEERHALDVGLEASIMDGSIAHTFDSALKHLSSFDDSMIKEEQVGSAKTNLLNFQAIGFFENYDPFIRALASRLEIPLENVPHENISIWKPPVIEMSEEARKTLRRMLNYDYQLYNFAKRTWGDFKVI